MATLQDLAGALSRYGQYSNGALGGANANQSAAGTVAGSPPAGSYPGQNLGGNAGVAARAGYYGGQVEGAKAKSEIEYQTNVGRSFLLRAQNEAILADDAFIRDPARGWWLGYNNPAALRGVIQAANQRRVAAGLEPYDAEAVISAYSAKPPDASASAAPTPKGGLPAGPKPSDTPDTDQSASPYKQSGGAPSPMDKPSVRLAPDYSGGSPFVGPSSNIAAGLPTGASPIPISTPGSLSQLASLLGISQGAPMGMPGMGAAGSNPMPMGDARPRDRRPYGNYREWWIRHEAGQGDPQTDQAPQPGSLPAGSTPGSPPGWQPPMAGGTNTAATPEQNFSLNVPGAGNITLPPTARFMLGRNAQDEYQGWINKGAPADLAASLVQAHTNTLAQSSAAEMASAGFPVSVIQTLTGIDLAKAQTGEATAMGKAATSNASTAAGQAETGRLGTVVAGYNSIVANDQALLDQNTITRTGTESDYDQAVKDNRITSDFRGRAFDTLTMGEQAGTGAIPGANEYGSNVLGGSIESGRSSQSGNVGTRGGGHGAQRVWREYKNPELASKILLDIQSARDAQKVALGGASTNFNFNQGQRQTIDSPSTPHDINIAADLANGTYKDPNTGQTMNFSQYIDALRRQGNLIGAARAQKVHSDWLMAHHENIQAGQTNPYSATPQGTPAQPDVQVGTSYREESKAPTPPAIPPVGPSAPQDPFTGATGLQEFWWRVRHPGGTPPPPGYFHQH